MVRQRRSIQLDPPEEKAALPAGTDFYKVESLKGGGTRRIERIGTKLITTLIKSTRVDGVRRQLKERAVQSAIVRFSKIVNACEVDIDEDSPEKPWENDVYAHKFTEITAWCAGRTKGTGNYPVFNEQGHRVCDAEGYQVWRSDADLMLDAARASQGFLTEDNDEFVIEPEWESGLADHLHHHGASKQVAREMQAQALRNDIQKIVSWRKDGYTGYYTYVRCKFMGASAGLHGIGDEVYALEEVRYEVAGEVAYKLEERGFLVRGSREPPKKERRKRQLRYMREQMNSQNWRD